MSQLELDLDLEQTNTIRLNLDDCDDNHLGLLESLIDIMSQTADTLYHQQLEAAFEPACYINGKLVDLLTLMKLYQDPDLNFIGLNACTIPPYADAEILYEYRNSYTIKINVSDFKSGFYIINLDPLLSQWGLIISSNFEMITEGQEELTLTLYNIGEIFHFLTEDVILGSILKIPTNIN